MSIPFQSSFDTVALLWLKSLSFPHFILPSLLSQFLPSESTRPRQPFFTMADAGAPNSTQMRNQLQKEDDAISRMPTQHLEHSSDSSSQTAAAPHQKHWQWEYGPLSRVDTTGERLPAFGGDFQPGLYKPPKRNIANPAPLGLAGFALTTFVLSLINLQTDDITNAAIVIAPAFAYGGLCQLLAGMWEFPSGNTFGAWALSTYGGFWISIGIILTPGGFDIVGSYPSPQEFYVAFGLYIFVSFCEITFTIYTLTSAGMVYLHLSRLDVYFEIHSGLLVIVLLRVGYVYIAGYAYVQIFHAICGQVC